MRPASRRDEPYVFPRVQAVPGVGRVSIQVDGVERVGYETATGGPRPFFSPLIGPAGRELTRLGHPDDPVGHVHHWSIWFGHQFVDGVNFWGDFPGRDSSIRHKNVVAYRDGADWAGFAADLVWWSEGRALMNQRLIAAIEPTGEDGEFALDLQCHFETASGRPVALDKTNFGFLGVRVARTISEAYGNGRLTNSESVTGEDAIFGKPARWVDYSGPVTPETVEGIAYLDHPANPGHPTSWHVRRDGWMCASFNLAEAYGLATDHPLDLRYRLWVHRGPAEASSIDAQWRKFAAIRPYGVAPPEGGAGALLQRA